MFIEIYGTPTRDLSTIDYSAITSATVVSVQVPQTNGPDVPYVIEFSQDLTADQVSLVELWALTDDNGQAIYEKALTAIGVNNNFLALTSPTNAQVLTQVQRLTRENTGLIRLMLKQLSTTSGT